MKTEHIVLGGLALGGLALALSPKARKKTKKAVGLSDGKIYPVKKISKRIYEKYNVDDFPNFHKSGSIKGMKKQYYGKSAKLVRYGNYIYNVSRKPEIYDEAN